VSSSPKHKCIHTSKGDAAGLLRAAVAIGARGVEIRNDSKCFVAWKTGQIVLHRIADKRAAHKGGRAAHVVQPRLLGDRLVEQTVEKFKVRKQHVHAEVPHKPLLVHVATRQPAR
jgi:hypothetical protein